jgi:hypothetical protein
MWACRPGAGSGRVKGCPPRRFSACRYTRRAHEDLDLAEADRVALAMPALATCPQESDFRGFLCLIGCRMLAGDEPRWAEAFGVLATLLATSYVYTVGVGEVRLGYWLWLGSMVALVAAGIEQGRGAVRVAKAMAWDD